MTQLPTLDQFPHQAHDTIRYGDTDRQGHVNNAVFATYLETGRVGILQISAMQETQPGTSFVLARLVLDYRAEITWPGTVLVGTRVVELGRSSIRLEQALFQAGALFRAGACVATAETVIVLVDNATHKSTPLSDASKEVLSRWSSFSFLDSLLLTYATSDWSKTARVVGQTFEHLLNERLGQIGDVILFSRLRALIEAGKIEVKGDPAHIERCEVRANSTSPTSLP